MRRKPVRRALGEPGIGKIRPAATRSLGRTQEGDALAQLRLRLAPGQNLDAEAGKALCQDDGILLARLDRQGTLGQDQRPETPAGAGAQRPGGAIERGLGLLRQAGADQAGGGERGDLGIVDGGGAENPGLGGSAGHLADDQIGLARQPLAGLQGGAAAIGQQILARARLARLGDPVGKGERQQETGRMRTCLALRRLRLRLPRPTLGEAAHVGGAAAALAPETLQALGEVDRIAAEPALDQEGGQRRRLPGLAEAGGAGDHMGEARRQRQRLQRLAGGSDAAVGIERFQIVQQQPRFLQRRGGWRIEEGERRGVGDAPGGAVEQQRGKVGGEDLRPGEGLERTIAGLLPEPVADAGLGAAGAAATLVGGRTASALGDKPGDADIGLVKRHPRQAGIDDDTHALDGQRGLGDRGRQHDLAPAQGGRQYGAVLLGLVERTIERRDLDSGIADLFAQALLDPANLALAGQEDEERAALLVQRQQDGLGDLVLDALQRVAAEIACLDGIGATLALNHRGIAEQARDSRAVERRRHHEDAQVLAQTGLGVERQSEAEIGIERALVKFVEEYRRDTLQRGVVEDHPSENAFGDDLDARLRPDLRAEADTQADRLTDTLAKRLRHAGGGAAGGEPARLQHDQLAALAAILGPGLVQQGERHARGLAGAGRGDEHRVRPRAQGGGQIVENGVDRQGCVEAAHAGMCPGGKRLRKRFGRV